MQSSRRSRAGKGRSKRSHGGGGKALPKDAGSRRLTGRTGHSGSYKAEYAAGFAEAAAILRNGAAPLAGHEAKLLMNEHWTRRSLQGALRSGSQQQRGMAFADGFAAGLRLPGGMWVPVALTRSAAAVVMAGPNARLESVQQLLRLPLDEIVIVQEAAGGEAFNRFRALPDVTIIHTREKLGMDVGRTVGARLTNAELVLFVDGEAAVSAEQLAVLLAEAQAGSDLVLADVSGRLGAFRGWSDAARIQAFMNWSLGKPELQANSVAVLPHAWSRPAMERVGLPLLAVPPMAHRAAIEHQLRIRCFPVAAASPAALGTGSMGPADAAKLSAGDHIEALRAAMRTKGARLSLPDGVRRRLAAGRSAT
ncbi:glycosyltransferase family 2 protein [Paenibacillus sacheonensis]|uniref:Glycosyltransferase 2-like domain-containing protein n=1 Tax=Paenibacillus sacheonensis TaxID=742054 RepID=A0A7X5C2W2_9BACL|nr:glycosyltransferase family 2 protein [Paenibacillus sacheonensis]MBM7566723.1 hypothetical protein [Paenibacillus sacheonensis]NBC71700.1 hypothetical protein [Paenibacillus sacheonensis]